MTDINKLSIYGDYSQRENRITTALLHILNFGKEDCIRFLLNKLNIELPESEINIISQDRGGASIPDGVLECKFNFKILIETKITTDKIKKIQLENHLNKIINKENHFLIYLTPHNIKPRELPDMVEWVNFNSIISYLNEYIEISENEILNFLITNFELLLINLKLFSQEWDWRKNNTVAIFAGGRIGLKDALTKRKYICPNQSSRKIQPVGYIGIYANMKIKHIFKVEKAPDEDEHNLYYNLGEEIIINEIVNNKMSITGKRVGWLMGRHRYTTLEKIKAAKFTLDLE